MKGYSCAEVGMLIGAALGGILSALGFALTSNYFFLILTVVGIIVGVSIGSGLDRKKDAKKGKSMDI